MTADRVDGGRGTVARETLRVAVGLSALAYLSLPVGAFLLGWLRPWWGALTTAALGAGVIVLARRFREAGTASGDDPPVRVATLAMAVVVVAMVVALNGPGGFGVQTSDWAKHNAILKDLIEQPWPVAYATGRGDVGLTYYVAYYLPAALVGKLAGWRVANVALFVWTTLGCTLAMLWLVVLSRAPVWRSAGVFVLFSGLDVIGAAAWSSRWTTGSWISDFDAEWWAGHWTYPANVTLIAYAPHQAIGGWLLTGLLVDGLRRYPARFPYLLAGSLGLLWSPFVAVGLLGCAGLARLADPGRRQVFRASLPDAACVAGLSTGLVLALYFLSRYWPVDLPEPYYPPPHRLAAAGLAFLPTRLPWREFAADYVVFVLLEFLVLAVVLGAIFRGIPADRRLLPAAAVPLLLLPFLSYGEYNDLVMRVSIPALFVLQLLAVRAPDVPGRPALRAALAAVLVVGAVYPVNMLRLSAGRIVGRGALVRTPPEARVPDLFEQQLAMRKRYFFLGQYVGALDAPFFQHLARRPLPVPKGPHARR